MLSDFTVEPKSDDDDVDEDYDNKDENACVFHNIKSFLKDNLDASKRKELYV